MEILITVGTLVGLYLLAKFGFFMAAISGTIIGIYFLREWMQGKCCWSRARLDDKTVVITGGNTGIGKETARDLSRRGARVILGCRDICKGEAAAKEISDISGRQVIVRHLDLTVFDSVVKFAHTLMHEETHIHILINNAGVMMCGHQLTVDGNELQFQTNHLGHFLLTNLLLPMMKKSQPARIINLSSSAQHIVNQINFDNLTGESSYNRLNAYAQSKLANVLFSTSLHRLLQGSGVTVYSVNPGSVRTEISRHVFADFLPVFLRPVFEFLNTIFLKTSVNGAQTSIFCAVDAALVNESGKYYSDCCEARANSYALKEENAEKLWKISEEIVSKWLPSISFNKEISANDTSDIFEQWNQVPVVSSVPEVEPNESTKVMDDVSEENIIEVSRKLSTESPYYLHDNAEINNEKEIKGLEVIEQNNISNEKMENESLDSTVEDLVKHNKEKCSVESDNDSDSVTALPCKPIVSSENFSSLQEQKFDDSLERNNDENIQTSVEAHEVFDHFGNNVQFQTHYNQDYSNGSDFEGMSKHNEVQMDHEYKPSIGSSPFKKIISDDEDQLMEEADTGTEEVENVLSSAAAIPIEDEAQTEISNTSIDHTEKNELSQNVDEIGNTSKINVIEDDINEKIGSFDSIKGHALHVYQSDNITPVCNLDSPDEDYSLRADCSLERNNNEDVQPTIIQADEKADIFDNNALFQGNFKENYLKGSDYGEVSKHNGQLGQKDVSSIDSPLLKKIVSDDGDKLMEKPDISAEVEDGHLSATATSIKFNTKDNSYSEDELSPYEYVRTEFSAAVVDKFQDVYRGPDTLSEFMNDKKDEPQTEVNSIFIDHSEKNGLWQNVDEIDNGSKLNFIEDDIHKHTETSDAKKISELHVVDQSNQMQSEPLVCKPDLLEDPSLLYGQTVTYLLERNDDEHVRSTLIQANEKVNNFESSAQFQGNYKEDFSKEPDCEGVSESNDQLGQKVRSYIDLPTPQKIISDDGDGLVEEADKLAEVGDNVALAKTISNESDVDNNQSDHLGEDELSSYEYVRTENETSTVVSDKVQDVPSDSSIISEFINGKKHDQTKVNNEFIDYSEKDVQQNMDENGNASKLNFIEDDVHKHTDTSEANKDSVLHVHQSDLIKTDSTKLLPDLTKEPLVHNKKEISLLSDDDDDMGNDPTSVYYHDVLTNSPKGQKSFVLDSDDEKSVRLSSNIHKNGVNNNV